MNRQPRMPLSKRRVAKLIWVGGGYAAGMNFYTLYSSGWNGLNPEHHYGTYTTAVEDQRRFREYAYAQPHLFPLQALTLSEWAKIKYWQLRQE
jgi:hypothetical protein